MKSNALLMDLWLGISLGIYVLSAVVYLIHVFNPDKRTKLGPIRLSLTTGTVAIFSMIAHGVKTAHENDFFRALVILIVSVVVALLCYPFPKAAPLDNDPLRRYALDHADLNGQRK